MKQQKWKRKKGTKIFLAILIIIAAIGMSIIGVLYYAARSMGAGADGVADYDARVEIWHQAAGNTVNSKLDDMNIRNGSSLFFSTIQFADIIVGNKYEDAEQTVDTFTYLYEIERGFEKDTYEDEAYLIPYLVNGSDCAVIVIPGGGFGYKSMDGTTGEGKDVALALNGAGINAFVLHYRTNPYEYPIPYLDLQRAIRYLRYHADTYHIDSNKISMIGFSAGGNLVATFINAVMGNDFFPEGYITDEIDETDDSVSAVAMLYPAVSFNFNVPMLFCMFDGELVRDDEARGRLLSMMDMTENFNSSEVEQFIAYGSKDTMVGTDEVQEYIKKAEGKGAGITAVIAENQGHGFDQSYYMDDFIHWLRIQFN